MRLSSVSYQGLDQLAKPLHADFGGVTNTPAPGSTDPASGILSALRRLSRHSGPVDAVLSRTGPWSHPQRQIGYP